MLALLSVTTSAFRISRLVAVSVPVWVMAYLMLLSALADSSVTVLPLIEPSDRALASRRATSMPTAVAETTPVKLLSVLVKISLPSSPATGVLTRLSCTKKLALFRASALLCLIPVSAAAPPSE